MSASGNEGKVSQLLGSFDAHSFPHSMGSIADCCYNVVDPPIDQDIFPERGRHVYVQRMGPGLVSVATHNNSHIPHDGTAETGG